MAAAGQKWTEPASGIDFAAMKAGGGSADWPFGQAPRFSDGQVQNLTQTLAIVRYLGKKHKLYGDNIVEEAQIDQVLDGIHDWNGKYGPACFLWHVRYVFCVRFANHVGRWSIGELFSWPLTGPENARYSGSAQKKP